MDQDLILISKGYREKYDADSTDLKNRIKNIYLKYIKEREESLIDAMSGSVALGAILYSDTIDYNEITPQMEESFHLAFPSLEIESISNYSVEQLEGISSAWKGKYFEVLVKDRLNDGEWVGDIQLEPGQTAILAESPIQEGWDLQILNTDGSIAEEIQLKATNSLSYVKNAIEQYPDIDVMTTEEVSELLPNEVLNSGISNEELTDAIVEPMESLLDSPIQDFAETVLPGLPFIIIALTEGRHVMTGKRSFELAIGNSISRSIKTGLSMGVGGLVAFLDGGLFSIPAGFATRILFDRNQNENELVKAFSKQRNDIDKYKRIYS